MIPFHLDFFLLGAAKCGTTSLKAGLATHPQVACSEPKETRFFDRDYDMGLDYLQQCYAHAKAGQVRGEFSPQNLQAPFALQRIASHFPKAKLIVVLRNPVERAYSHWWMFHSNNREPRSFRRCLEACQEIDGDAFTAQLESEDGPELWRRAIEDNTTPQATYLWLIDGGFYDVQLSRCFQLFSREQILVLSFSLLKDNPGQVLREMAEFIGVDPAPLPQRLPKRNRAKGPLSVKLRNLSKRVGIHRFVPGVWRNALRNQLTKLGDRAPTISNADKALVETFYPGTKVAVRELLGKDYW